VANEALGNIRTVACLTKEIQFLNEYTKLNDPIHKYVAHRAIVNTGFVYQS